MLCRTVGDRSLSQGQVVTVVSSTHSCLLLKAFDVRRDRVGICPSQAVLHGSGPRGGERGETESESQRQRGTEDRMCTMFCESQALSRRD